MKKWLKNIVNFLLLGTMLLSGVACKDTGDSSGNKGPFTDEPAPILTSTTDTTIANMDRSNMFGICELPSEFGGGSTEKETTIEFVANSCKNLGVKSMRVWMHLKMVFTRDDDSDELFFKEEAVVNYHKYFQLLKAGGDMKTITRTKYLDRIIELNGTPDIKIITGIRQSGKSKLMQAYIEYLKSNFENIIICQSKCKLQFALYCTYFDK